MCLPCLKLPILRLRISANTVTLFHLPLNTHFYVIAFNVNMYNINVIFVPTNILVICMALVMEAFAEYCH